jgi:hypothetical protein
MRQTWVEAITTFDRTVGSAAEVRTKYWYWSGFEHCGRACTNNLRLMLVLYRGSAEFDSVDDYVDGGHQSHGTFHRPLP